MNSIHVTCSPESKLWINGMAGKLREFYRKSGYKLSETDLAMEIERLFGNELLEKVCIPHDLYSGACLLIAMEVAKEGG